MDNNTNNKESKNAQCSNNNDFKNSQDKEIDQKNKNNLRNTQNGSYEDIREFEFSE